MSLNNNPSSKPATVICAVHGYTAQNDNEFSFNKEDCFYMLGTADDRMDYIHVIHPRSRKKGLVPARNFEFVPTTALNKLPSKTKTKTKTILAYVTETSYRASSEDLGASRGDPILILEDHSPNYYFAKLIGKVGPPGRILKRHVEVKEDIASNQPRVLRYNSTGKIPTKQEQIKSRSLSSRRADSNFSDPTSNFNEWRMDTTNASHNNQSDVSNNTSIVLDSVPVASIQIIRGVVFENQPIIELLVRSNDNSTRTILRDSLALQKLQINLLEVFPKEAGLTGSTRTLPYMPQLGQSNANISTNKAISKQEIHDFNTYFKELLNLNALLPRCRPLLEFIVINQNDLNVINRTKKSATNANNPILARKASSPLVTSTESHSPPLPPLSTSPTSSNASSSERELPSPPLLPSSSQPTNVKIKLKVHDDLMAFWMSSTELTYTTLLAKIQDRIGTTPARLAYSHATLPGTYKVSNQKDLVTCLLLTKNKPIFEIL